MTPERWIEVKEALNEALSLSDGPLARYLERLGAADPELRREVESLLDAERAAGSLFLDTPAPAVLEVDAQLAADTHPYAPRAPLEGRRFGAYRMIAEIGGGGMGQVYRAYRADDEYRQEVAIKVVRAGVDAEFVGQRLRTERQILASFAHPNIARLLDGGTSDDGVPYLVMELIDGEPINRYCASRLLDVRARLELFLEVCSAVQYAHQRMVIHRDLKPSNILVTADGTPKLLDFGIAKALEPGIIPVAADATINTMRILTPEYASPEQMKGEPVTAASDVYSLGIILYELLTGTKAHRSSDRLTRDVAKAVLDPPLKKPSTVVRQGAGLGRRGLTLTRRVRTPQEAMAGPAEGSPEKLSRRLRGDLDNIVLMALRREPERRYGTVEQLALDIRRHLARRPVSARAATIRYHAASFIVRHKLAVAAVALIAAALIGGIIMTAREARIAEHQRARAEQRFDDVHRLAKTLIFEIHDSIRDLPGAEQSRRLLISTAMHYLDSLSKDASGDPSLERELAAAYVRLGDLQGRAREANSGDYAGALASVRRALALLEAGLKTAPRDPDLQRDLIVASGKLSDLMWSRDDAAGALSYSEQTRRRSRALAEQAPDNRLFRYFEATSLLDHGYKLFKIRGDLAGAADEMRRSISMLESLHASDSSDPLAARTLTLGYARIGELFEFRHDDSTALAEHEKELRLVQTLARAAPHNADLAHLKAFAEQDVADALSELGRLDEAQQHYETALASFRALSASDPRIAEYRWDEGQAISRLADLSGRSGQPRRAIALLQQALAAMNMASKDAANDANFRFIRAHAEALLGDQYGALAMEDSSREARLEAWRTAKGWYQKALSGYRALTPAWFEAGPGARAIAEKIRQCDDALSPGTT